MWNWDPISAVSAYFCSASVIDQVLTRLPCSDDGHTCVDWRLLRYVYPTHIEICLSKSAVVSFDALLSIFSKAYCVILNL